MMQIGIVSDVKPGFAKVSFAEDKIVSEWWPIVKMGTQNSKFCYPLHIGEQVACVSDEHSDDGIVLGAIYSDEDTPPQSANNHTYVYTFEDGTEIIYDVLSHELTANIKGNATISAKKVDVTVTEGVTIKGNLTVIGNVAAGGLAISSAHGGDGSITSDADFTTSGDVKAGTVSLKTHIHTGIPTTTGTSGPPKP